MLNSFLSGPLLQACGEFILKHGEFPWNFKGELAHQLGKLYDAC